MTEQPLPPPYDPTVPVRQVLVADRPREPRPRGLSIVVLGIVVAVLAGYVAVLLIGQRQGALQRRELACEVQRLGGKPVGGVDCPRPTARPTRTSSTVPTPLPVVVVSPPMPTRGPAGPPGPRGPAGATSAAPRATPRVAASRRPPVATAPASPRPTPCAIPNPLPAGPRCLAAGAGLTGVRSLDRSDRRPT